VGVLLEGLTVDVDQGNSGGSSRLEPVPKTRGDAHERRRFVVEAQLSHFAVRRRALARVKHNNLGPAGEDGDLVDLHLVAVPRLDHALGREGHVDLSEGRGTGNRGGTHLHQVAAIVLDDLERLDEEFSDSGHRTSCAFSHIDASSRRSFVAS
jgi:hypothetical protein